MSHEPGIVCVGSRDMSHEPYVNHELCLCVMHIFYVRALFVCGFLRDESRTRYVSHELCV